MGPESHLSKMSQVTLERPIGMITNKTGKISTSLCYLLIYKMTMPPAMQRFLARNTAPSGSKGDVIFVLFLTPCRPLAPPKPPPTPRKGSQ